MNSGFYLNGLWSFPGSLSNVRVSLRWSCRYSRLGVEVEVEAKTDAAAHRDRGEQPTGVLNL
jgi:hypothetical protein